MMHGITRSNIIMTTSNNKVPFTRSFNYRVVSHLSNRSCVTLSFPINFFMLSCPCLSFQGMTAEWLERFKTHIPSKSSHSCPCANKKTRAALFCSVQWLMVSTPVRTWFKIAHLTLSCLTNQHRNFLSILKAWPTATPAVRNGTINREERPNLYIIEAIAS